MLESGKFFLAAWTVQLSALSWRCVPGRGKHGAHLQLVSSFNCKRPPAYGATRAPNVWPRVSGSAYAASNWVPLGITQVVTHCSEKKNYSKLIKTEFRNYSSLIETGLPCSRTVEFLFSSRRNRFSSSDHCFHFALLAKRFLIVVQWRVSVPLWVVASLNRLLIEHRWSWRQCFLMKSFLLISSLERTLSHSGLSHIRFLETLSVRGSLKRVCKILTNLKV